MQMLCNGPRTCIPLGARNRALSYGSYSLYYSSTISIISFMHFLIIYEATEIVQAFMQTLFDWQQLQQQYPRATYVR